MNDPDRLNIWHDRHLVGTLRRNTIGAIIFCYDAGWITHGFSISRSLPLGPEEFTPEKGIAHRFFANLLPEGGVRERIVRELKLPDTDFDLLRAIGGECAGALSVLPTDRKPSREWRYRTLSEDDLAGMAARGGQIFSTGPAEQRPRLSLAGAQNKCPVLLRGGHYQLPQGESPSSHILKFELADYRHLPAYETFTMRLAHAIGLPVAAITLCSAGRMRYTQIERYDRLLNETGEMQRLHQEDFCQALGLGHQNKYQQHGGPSFAECFCLLQDVSSEPAIDAQHLLRWQVFNVLAGNSDGHAKNLSLLIRPDGEIRLAPFYDMVCTRAIERIDEQLAFDVGGERNPSLITRDHWESLARDCDIRPEFLLALLDEVTTQLRARIVSVREAFEALFGPYPALQRVEQVVHRQIRRASRG